MRLEVLHLLTSAVFSETIHSCVRDVHLEANVVMVESPPHDETVVLLPWASGELASTAVEALGQPIDQDLLELDGKVVGWLVKWPESLVAQSPQ